jgi:BirA family transcriptional regulator, biotin operon repressor / biotin---[acetyl-CoA-carboxylase] ligase
MVTSLFSLPLDSRRISTALAGCRIGGEVRVLEDTASTNDEVRELGMAGFPHGLVVLTENQSAGRGRRENVWHAPPGRDVLMTVLLRPEARLQLWPRVTTLAALSICRSIEECTALKPAIKWPNDIYLSDRKCAGILAETFTSASGPFMALGIGLNVNSDQFPPDLRSTATSLMQEQDDHQARDRNALVISLLKQLDQQLQRIEVGFDQIITQVRQRSWLLGRDITAVANGNEISGKAVDVNEEGHLVITQATGEFVTLSSAEQVRRA